MASIRLQNITKKYDNGVLAVSDFTMEIADREFIVLVGPSGCGKSTTLRMIAGLEEITSGELYIGDRLVNDLPPRERDISMVFQNYALYPHMTVFQNMAFGLENRKMPKAEIEAKVHEAAAILGIEDLLKRKPKAMSGGQRQRVALGRAIVRNPAVFLLDEPLSNLDAKLRASRRGEIIKLHQRLGTTFIYVTHDQVEAMTMGDRIVVMKDGHVHQIDTPQNLYHRPCNLFVASFIGTPQMNFIDVDVSSDDAGVFLALHEARIRMTRNQELLLPYLGKTVVLGIRPDAIMPAAEGNVPAMLEVAEALGGETYLYLDYQGDKITVRVPGTLPARPGALMPLAFDGNRLHIFDKETKRAICH